MVVSSEKRTRGPNKQKPWARRPEDGASVLRLPLDTSDPVQRARIEAMFEGAYVVRRALQRDVRDRARAYWVAKHERAKSPSTTRERLGLSRKSLEQAAFAHLDGAPHLRRFVTKALAQHLADSVWTATERHLFGDAKGKRAGAPRVGRWFDFRRLPGRARSHEKARKWETFRLHGSLAGHRAAYTDAGGAFFQPRHMRTVESDAWWSYAGPFAVVLCGLCDGTLVLPVRLPAAPCNQPMLDHHLADSSRWHKLDLVRERDPNAPGGWRYEAHLMVLTQPYVSPSAAERRATVAIDAADRVAGIDINVSNLAIASHDGDGASMRLTRIERDATQKQRDRGRARRERRRLRDLERSRRAMNRAQYRLSKRQEKRARRRAERGLPPVEAIPMGPRVANAAGVPLRSFKKDTLSARYRHLRAAQVAEAAASTKARRDRAREVAAEVVATHGYQVVVEDVSVAAWSRSWGRAVAAFTPATLVAAIDREARAVAAIAGGRGGVERASTRTTALSQHCPCGARARKRLGDRTHDCVRCELRGDHDDVSAILASFVVVERRGDPSSARVDYDAASRALPDIRRALENPLSGWQDTLSESTGLSAREGSSLAWSTPTLDSVAVARQIVGMAPYSTLNETSLRWTKSDRARMRTNLSYRYDRLGLTGQLLAMRFVALLALGIACGDNAPPPFVPLSSGAAELSLDGDALVFSRNAQTLLTLRAEDFQIGTVDDLDSGASFDPFWLVVDNAPAPPEGLTWHPGATFRVRASDTQHATFDLGDGTLTITTGTEGGFALTFRSELASAAYLRIAPTVDETDRFYGLGEWGDGVEHRGKIRPAQLEVDTTLESSNNENHVPVPLVIGTRGWGLFVASDRPGVFDLGKTDPSRLDVTFGTAGASADGLRVHLFSADAPLDVLKPYYEVTGYPGLPAVWAYGPLLWRDEHRDQAQVLDDITQIRTRDLATSGIWFDRPYATGVNTFDWDATKFPAPDTMLRALHDAGLRYAIWQAPYAAAADNDQDQAPEQNAYATAHNFFPPMTGVLVNQWGKPIDFTNPDAYAWWKQNLSKYTLPLGAGGFGVEGFKLDYAEDVVLGVSGSRVPWLFADGSDERTMHYGYTMLYHRIHRELLDQSGGFLLTRTGRWGDQTQGMIVWPGDLQADLSHFGDPRPGSSTKSVGGLPTALSFGIGLSASGFPFYASDTGGYRSSPANNETWLRWVEANTVWSAMQVGDSSSEMPWEFTPENGRTAASLDTYRLYARLHMRLFPYAWSYATAMATTGRPLVRPFGLAYPDLDQHPADEYLFGDYLLVAPVITAGATSRELQFPPGSWIDWWTGDVYNGGTKQTVDAPLDTLPLFLAAGGIVPMLRDTIDTLAASTTAGVDSFVGNPGILVVRMTPGPDATSLALYDGGSIEQKTDGSEITFVEGTTFTTGVLFEIVARTDIPVSVRNGDTPLTQRASRAALDAATDGWFWEPALGGTLWIKLPGGGASLLIDG